MATNTKILISDILQIVSDLRGESTTNTDAARIRAVSRAEKYFARKRYWQTHLLTEQTITGDGSTSYTIGSATYPMRLKGLVELYVGGTTDDYKYQIVDQMAFKNLVDRNSAEKIAYEWYDIANDIWKVRINPTVATGTTAYYSYYYEPPVKTSSAEYVYCANPMIIVKLTMGDIAEGEEELQTANLVRTEAEQLIEELSGREMAPARNQTYSMGAIENASSEHGIGSY
jgi:hypothetical protein